MPEKKGQFCSLKKQYIGNSLVVQWLGFWAFTAGGPGSIPVWGNKFLRAAQCGQKEQKKEHGELALVDSIESWVGNWNLIFISATNLLTHFGQVLSFSLL